MVDQVVFGQIAAGFHRDQGDGQAARVRQPVRLAKRDVDGLTLPHQAGTEAEGDFCGAFDDDPVFGAMEVGLQRRRLAGGKTNRADPKATACGENRVCSNRLRAGEACRRFGETWLR